MALNDGNWKTKIKALILEKKRKAKEIDTFPDNFSTIALKALAKSPISSSWNSTSEYATSSTFQRTKIKRNEQKETKGKERKASSEKAQNNINKNNKNDKKKREEGEEEEEKEKVEEEEDTLHNVSFGSVVDDFESDLTDGGHRFDDPGGQHGTH